jgi:hypothetical protein
MLCSLRAQIIYVKAGSQGNGSSWDSAYGDLQKALRHAVPGTQIWVAAGTYYPTQTGDRDVSFVIPEGVELYGGFMGFEASVQERDLVNNLSVLSGDIGDPASKDDNSYTVVYTKNVTSSTLIDGFVIQGGMANGTGKEGDIRRCGAGWYNDGSNGESSPEIRNCLFRNNQGRDGAALYNYAFNGVANPYITNCRFIANAADLDGAGVFNDGSHGICSPVIEGCLFEKNKATYGAGIMNKGVAGETRPEIRNCQFFGNMSYIRGSSIYNNRTDDGICSPVIQGCLFEDNLASVGRDVSSTIKDTVADKKSKPNVIFRSGY